MLVTRRRILVRKMKEVARYPAWVSSVQTAATKEVKITDHNAVRTQYSVSAGGVSSHGVYPVNLKLEQG